MNRRLVISLASLLFIGAPGVFLTARAQESAAPNAATIAARAAADREAAEERYRQMSSDIQSLLTAQEVQQKRLSALADELKRVKEEHSTFAGRSFATREELREVIEKIQELDRKREADKKLIIEEMDKLGKLLQNPPPRRAEKPEKPDKPEPGAGAGPTKATATGAEHAYAHEVQKGEYLSLILAAYNAKFKEQGKKTISLKQVQDANPDINLDKIVPGQKVLIPEPAK